MIARAQALSLLAVFAFPASLSAQQPRSQTVFAPGQNGAVSIRIAVVLADYTVKPLPLVPVIARRNDRADSVAGRTDLEGRLSMTLPVGQYTIRAYTPLPIAGRSYMWAVPVAVRASMTEAIQLTNANASVDSSLVATAPSAATPNRQMVETQSAAISDASARTMSSVERERIIPAEPAAQPAAPVAEATFPVRSVPNAGAVRSAPTRANTSGFILGLSLNGSSIRFDDASSSIESGGGISTQIGWGFTRNFALLLDISGAAISSDGGDYGLGHAEVSGRWHFASPNRALVPFLEVGWAERAVVQNDVVYFDDFGNSLAGDFSLLGSGVSFGGGLQYHVSPTMALGGSLKWTVGSFSTVRLDNVSVDGLDISATTARINLGFTWYPVMGATR